ncbi:glycosyltransferase family 9 protein [Enterobacteriaceae bacterium LUAb1]
MKILIIRRDNIGDLILTTPVIATLASSLNNKVDVLVNSYNQPVLEGNPHIDKIHLYSKLHHRRKGRSAISVIFQRIKTMIDIRLTHYDVAIIARDHWDKRSLQWAMLSGAKRIIAIGNNTPAAITDVISPPAERCHAVEFLAHLASPLGIDEIPGPLRLYVRDEEVTAIRERIDIPDDLPVYGLQISARKPQQRWQVEKFIKLAHQLAAHERCQLLLFWSPGDHDNPLHPGDDEKAVHIMGQCRDINLQAVKTDNLRELMAAMSLCDQILTSDGGALHIAAGTGKPTVAMFGNSDAWFWRPWGVPYEILEAPDRNVSLLDVDAVLDRFITLRTRVLSENTNGSVPLSD